MFAILLDFLSNIYLAFAYLPLKGHAFGGRLPPLWVAKPGGDPNRINNSDHCPELSIAS